MYFNSLKWITQLTKSFFAYLIDDNYFFHLLVLGVLFHYSINIQVFLAVNTFKYSVIHVINKHNYFNDILCLLCNKINIIIYYVYKHDIFIKMFLTKP